jgi:hypothetical protein
MQEEQADSIAKYISIIKSIRETWTPVPGDPEELWFRGQSKRKYNLLPGLYRPDVVARQYDEPTIFETFKNLSMPFVRERPENEWEWYFMAQHYGLYTRLLDWTENPLAAVYFAISEEIMMRGKAELDKDLRSPIARSVHDNDSPCVWMIDAGTLNKQTSGEDQILATGGELTEGFLPGEVTAKLPIAIQPARANPRIVAQQGMFTVHGSEQIPLEDLGENHSTIRMAVISIDKCNLSRFWDDLAVMGINGLSIFPELQSVADYITWSYEIT